MNHGNAVTKAPITPGLYQTFDQNVVGIPTHAGFSASYHSSPRPLRYESTKRPLRLDDPKEPWKVNAEAKINGIQNSGLYKAQRDIL